MLRDKVVKKIILSGVKSISHSKWFVFALLTNGDLYGWIRDSFRKSNSTGALEKDGERTSQGPIIPDKMALQNVMMIKYGCIYRCVVTNNFELYTSKSFGILQKHPLSDTVDIVSVDCGEAHICALSKGGEVYTWGFNYCGQLGLGDLEDRSPPEKLNLMDVVSVGCGDSYSMALTKFGIIYVWGKNIGHKLSQGGEGPYCFESPHKLDFYNAVSISCGNEYAMALTTENIVYMWGLDIYPPITRTSMCIVYKLNMNFIPIPNKNEYIIFYCI